MVHVQAVSNYIVNDLTSIGEAVTNLRLQKLLYYAQAWHLVYSDGAPLFESRIEAWIHGPVVVEEYHRFKEHCSGPIPEQAPLELDSRTREFVDQVLCTYGVKTAYDLEILTHREKPWIEARGILAPTEQCREEITLRSMFDFYTGMRREQEAKEATR